MPYALRQLVLIDFNRCKQAHMIHLSLPKELYWLDLPLGVRVKVRPASTATAGAARAQAARRVEALRKDIADRKAAGVPLDGLPDLDDPDVVAGYSQLLVAQCYARAAIVEWEGVLEAASDTPAPATPEKIDDLMRMDVIAQAFLGRYLDPLNQVAAEGNASRPAPNGTSAAAPDTAPSAAEATPPAAEASPA